MASPVILNGAIKDQLILIVSVRWSLKTRSTFLANGFIIIFLFSKYFSNYNRNLFERGWGSHLRQISRVENCALTRVGDLAIDMEAAGCTKTTNAILMCFSNKNGDQKRCYKEDVMIISLS